MCDDPIDGHPVVLIVTAADDAALDGTAIAENVLAQLGGKGKSV